MLSIVIWSLILCGIFALLILASKSQAEEEEKNKKMIKECGEYLEQQIEETGFNSNIKYSYENQEYGILIVFSFDESAGTILIMNSRKQCDLIKFSDVIGYEVMEDNQVVGGISRAVVGGIIAGGAGAIIGSQTAHKKKVYSYGIAIYMNDIKNPRMMIPIITHAIEPHVKEYKKAIEFADHIGITLKTIIARNQAAANQ